ncbi:uncharacterized protein zgc:194948 [Triplophysa dalaica]|uniref:uncharacterized protein zgc:194948 n=1 Tax=Triplophysa dalaica TaxID=1582913 RepID=UPI0024DF667F|nr:uncharacterized protein zgc:194948 [Triplophysa dalaica]
MLAVLLILGTLCPLNFAALDISLLDPQSDEVLTAIFSDGFLLRFPNCTTYGGQDGAVLYQILKTDEKQSENFTVPNCSSDKRAPRGLLLKNLKHETNYSIWYKIRDEISLPLNSSTLPVTKFSEINDGLPARSGAMVVITVILALAMAVLLAGIISLIFISK